MAPRGRHLIETKDQKMFIMSIVQKKRIRKHHVHRTTGKQDERGEKFMVPSEGGDHHTIGTCEERERTTWLPWPTFN